MTRSFLADRSGINAPPLMLTLESRARGSRTKMHTSASMVLLAWACSLMILLIVAPDALSQAPSSAGNGDLAADMDKVAAGAYKPGAPGTAIIAVKDGRVIFLKGYGLANLELNVPITPEMVFRIGSVTKQFTAVALMMLVEQGKLSLQDNITKFFPDYPAAGKRITAENLLTHTSGIKDYTEKLWPARMREDLRLERLIEAFKNDGFEFEPGTKASYSNSNYILLGAIIEKLSGQPVPLEQRRERAFLRGICRRMNTKRIDTPLRIRVAEQHLTGGKIHVSFYDKNNSRLRFKEQDTVYYQYAWSLPAAYATTEEELEPLGEGVEIDDRCYNQGEVIANHGLVKKLEVEFRFEKTREPLFDKSPFYQQTASFSARPVWSKSAELQRTEREEDHQMWFESFLIEERNFQGRLRVLWRPASGKRTA